jgi:hypothetical protein
MVFKFVTIQRTRQSMPLVRKGQVWRYMATGHAFWLSPLWNVNP